MSDAPPPEDGAFDALLDYLHRTRGFDFRAYKRPGLMRRVERRLQVLGLERFGAYLDYLEVHPEEFARLFDALLINVTAFFRDPTAWELVQTDIIPRIVREKAADGPIRVWSAGCSSGEEAYTAAMLLAEVVGVEPFCERVKIYATDVDEDALNKARLAAYTPAEVAAVPGALRAKYFENAGDRFVFHKELRRCVIFGRHDLVQDAPISRVDLLVCRNTLMYFNKELRRCVIFGRHDLVQDAPISRVDLLVCRNTLMYFNAEVQDRILARFNFALNDHGFLFLGKAEMLLTHASYFSPLDLKRRIFTRVQRRLGGRERLLALAQAGRDDFDGAAIANHVYLREAAFNADPLPRLIVDVAGTLVLASERARALFNLGFKDLGRPLQDLEVSYRPVELRAYLEQAYAERRPVTLKEVNWPTPAGEARYLEVQIVPLADPGGNVLGACILFNDVTRLRIMQDELQNTHQELETAYEELQTSNEELQSTNEELETTNEELQSTNEELETMNEELQSTNEELRTMNDELHQRTEEMNRLNGFLHSILGGLRAAVVVLNRDLQVQAWNRRAEDTWGLRAEEAQGQHFLNLDIGLAVADLRPAVRAILTGESANQEVRLSATNRRGKAIQIIVSCSPLLSQGREAQGVILMMEEEGPSATA